MMKKLWTRIVSSALCACMLAAAFAGCSSKQENDTGYIITQNVIRIPSYQNGLTLTLDLENGEWTDGIGSENVSLSGGFSSMTVKSLTAGKNRLSIELDGTPVPDTGLGIYTSGSITVNKDGIKDGKEDATVSVSIDSVNLYVETEKLRLDGGKIILPLVLTNQEWSDTADKSDFSIDGLIVSDFKKEEAASAQIVIESDAADVNEAAALLNEKILTAAADALSSETELSAAISCPPAAFYPVFDYVEAAGDKLAFTLLLNAASGTFADTLAVEGVVFSGGFANASEVNLTRTSSTQAELSFRIPADDMTVETMNIEGTVTLNDGMLNRWGTKRGEVSYTRTYEQSNMGKGLSDADLSNIVKHVDGLINTPLSYVTSVGSGIASAGSAIYSILQITGVVPSEKSMLTDLQKEMNALRSDVSAIRDSLAELKTSLDKNHTQDIVSDFRTDYLDEINSQYNSMVKALKLLAAAHPELVKEDDITTNEALCRLFVESNPVLASDIKVMTDKLCNRLIAREKAVGKNDPINAFDQLMSYTYNFSSQCYALRVGFRSEIIDVLDKAGLACLVVQAGEIAKQRPAGDNAQTYNKQAERLFTELKDVIENAKKSVRKDMPEKIRTEDHDWYEWANIYCYTVGSYVNTEITNISDSRDKWPQSIPEDAVSVFAQKLNGKTVREELASAGITDASNYFQKYGPYLAFRGYERDDDDHEWYFDVLPVDKKNPKPEKYTVHFYDHDYYWLFGGKITIDRNTCTLSNYGH